MGKKVGSLGTRFGSGAGSRAAPHKLVSVSSNAEARTLMFTCLNSLRISLMLLLLLCNSR